MTDEPNRIAPPEEVEARDLDFAHRIAAAGSALLPGFAEAVRRATDEEVAGMELAVIAQPSLLPVLVLEARRRAAVITELFQRTPWNGPSRGTPLAAALRSVAADIAAGRLP